MSMFGAQPPTPRGGLNTYNLGPAFSGASREGRLGPSSAPCLGPCSGSGSGRCPVGSRAGSAAEEAPSLEPPTLLRVYMVQSPRVPGAAAAGGLQAGPLSESPDAILKKRGRGFNS